MATEYGLWKVFEVGDYLPTMIEEGVRVAKTEDEFDKNDRRLVTLNSKAILMFQSALIQKRVFPDMQSIIGQRSVEGTRNFS